MNDKPLRHIRVLEIGGYISAPYASSLLCSLGADVVKVEKPGSGEDFRRQVNDASPYFAQYNAGKRSMSVDLKTPEGIALIKALVPRFDVVLENLRPGKLSAIGLGHADCSALRPDLVYVSVTGFGEGGPLAHRASYDAIGQALGGLHSVLGDAGRPQLSGTCIADLVTGLATATAITAALAGRASSGEGQHVQTSVLEAVSVLTADALTQYYEDDHADPSRQSRHPQAQNFCLRTSSGDSIAIHLSSSQKFWLAFVRAMGRSDLADDPRFITYSQRVANYFELAEIVRQEFAGKPASEWEKLLTDADVPYAPVLTMSGFIGHPQTEWLGLLEPERNGLQLVRPPWRFNGTRPERSSLPPRVGQDTREIAAEVYDDNRIQELLAAGVLYADSAVPA